MNKQDIIKWYHTSVLPVGGTEELNKFMLDIAVRLTPEGVRYKNITKAKKAYAKYKFTEADIKKIYSDVPLI